MRSISAIEVRPSRTFCMPSSRSRFIPAASAAGPWLGTASNGVAEYTANVHGATTVVGDGSHTVSLDGKWGLPRVTLNSDGERHPLENGLAVFTLLAGLVAFPAGFMKGQHVLASWAGIENYEERLLPGRIDPVVLEQLRVTSP